MRVARRKRLGSRSAGIVAVAAAGLVLASCSSAPPASSPGSAGASGASQGGGVISLTSISTLKTLFNRDSGHPRLVLIFSPT